MISTRAVTDEAPKELAICTLLGAIPLFLAYSIAGPDAILNSMKALVDEGLLLYYSVGIAVLYFLILAFVNYFISSNKSFTRTLSFFANVFAETGTGLLGSYRTLTGILLAIPALWVLHEHTPLAFAGSAMIFFWGFCFFVFTCIFSLFHKKSFEKIRFKIK